MRAYLTPRMLGAHLLVLASLAAAGGLGLWQLEAWQARRTAEAVDLTQETPRPLADVIGNDDPFPGRDVGRPVEVAGDWVADATVFVGGREHDGVEGYWVVTPVAVGGAGQPALPVVRGWVASPDDAPAPPASRVELVGWLQPPEGTGEVDDDPTDDVFPQLRVADLAQRVPQDLYSAYAIALPDVAVAEGLAPADLEALPSAGRFTALRNFLYAVEWWFFGAFAAFIWWRFVREESQAAAVAGIDDEPTGTERPASTVEA